RALGVTAKIEETAPTKTSFTLSSAHAIERYGYQPKEIGAFNRVRARSEEHTSELQSPCNLVCRLLLEKKKKYDQYQFFMIDLCSSLVPERNNLPLYTPDPGAPHHPESEVPRYSLSLTSCPHDQKVPCR